MNFNLKKPCNNCPFNKTGAIQLESGRLEGIVENLLSDDKNHFQCHKTVHSKKGGSWGEDKNGEEIYRASGQESQCVGAMVYLLKVNAQNLSMRIGAAVGMLDFDGLRKQFDTVIEPLEETSGNPESK